MLKKVGLDTSLKGKEAVEKANTALGITAAGSLEAQIHVVLDRLDIQTLEGAILGELKKETLNDRVRSNSLKDWIVERLTTNEQLGLRACPPKDKGEPPPSLPPPPAATSFASAASSSSAAATLSCLSPVCPPSDSCEPRVLPTRGPSAPKSTCDLATAGIAGRGELRGKVALVAKSVLLELFPGKEDDISEF